MVIVSTIFFKKLCDYADIEAYYVKGDAFDAGRKGLHAWNIVKIDDRYYHVDTYWGKGNDNDREQFFNVSDELMESNDYGRRTWEDRDRLPVCSDNMAPKKK